MNLDVLFVTSFKHRNFMLIVLSYHGAFAVHTDGG